MSNGGGGGGGGEGEAEGVSRLATLWAWEGLWYLEAEGNLEGEGCGIREGEGCGIRVSLPCGPPWGGPRGDGVEGEDDL